MTTGTRHVAVTFAVDPAEAAAVDWAATRVLGPRTYEIIRDEEGNYELEVQFDGEHDPVEARDYAVKQYETIRRVAKLPEEAPRVTGSFRFSLAPVDQSFPYIDDAESFLETRQIEYAVVAAQIACEAEVRQTLKALVALESGLGSQLLSILSLRSFTLMDQGTQRVLAASGYSVTDQPWWKNYSAHVQRRNNIVHRATQITETEARESIESMWEVVEFMRSVRRRIESNSSE